MTTEQLAIVVPGAVSLGAVAITAWYQVRINRENLESQRKLALQERVRTTYEDMLHMTGWVMEIVNATKPIMEFKRSEPPQEPDMERVRSVQAKIGVHGSSEVKAILEQWAKLRNTFFSEAWLLDRMQNDEQLGRDVENSYGHPLVDQWKKVDEIRRELHAIVRELEDAANAEMRA
jgi:hypothetical protein